MNARELLDRMKANRVIVSNDDWQIIESALSLLAAAEANDGSTPLTDARKGRAYEHPAHAMVVQYHFAESIERRCSGLAAEVGRLREDGPSAVYLVMADYDYEGSTVVCAFAARADAALFVSRCNAHNDAKPSAPDTIEDTPENDAAFETHWAAYTKWESDHPAGNNSGADRFSVRELDIAAIDAERAK